MKSATYVVSALSAVVLAFPYDVPDFIIDVLMELTNYSSGGEASARKAARDTINEFRRTHQVHFDKHVHSSYCEFFLKDVPSLKPIHLLWGQLGQLG